MPGSFKQQLAAKGRNALFAFCEEQQIPVKRCGKVLLASNEQEIPRMQALADNGKRNGLQVQILDPQQLAEIEPHARALAAIYLPEAVIVNYSLVAQALAEMITGNGAHIKHGFWVEKAQFNAGQAQLSNSLEQLNARYVINCAGLHSDQVARILGARPSARIVPFRGQYFHLQGSAKKLVRALIYPLPDPKFPFLGVHLTRTMGGEVLAGPNAVLSFKREGYQRGDFNLADSYSTLSYAGFWRFALSNLSLAAGQYLRAWKGKSFAGALQKLVPEINPDMLTPGRSGVRAQALGADGKLLKDFVFEQGPRALHVINAPSPGATASLAIGRHIAEQALVVAD